MDKEASIDPRTRIGTVALTVADLEKQVAFYTGVLGFTLLSHHGARAGLGAGKRALLELTEVKGAPRAQRSTGLYHFAVLLPARRDLARAIGRLYQLECANYPTDHIMTKTTYLQDPEGQEIELYTESPEDGIMGFKDGEPIARRADGTPSNGREPMDLDALFGELAPAEDLEAPFPEETRIGHVHLYIRDLAESMRFYTEVIGFDSMGMSAEARMGMVSAGGYHHHVGLNTWRGEGAPPASPGSRGMRWFTIELPDDAELERTLRRVRDAGTTVEETDGAFIVRDPSGNAMRLVAVAQGE
jgi:catechol 2,3-dioxygenase